MSVSRKHRCFRNEKMNSGSENGIQWTPRFFFPHVTCITEWFSLVVSKQKPWCAALAITSELSVQSFDAHRMEGGILGKFREVGNSLNRHASPQAVSWEKQFDSEWDGSHWRCLGSPGGWHEQRSYSCCGDQETESQGDWHVCWDQDEENV